jgi:uncharacterized protein YndB with AHSA1/START domain
MNQVDQMDRGSESSNTRAIVVEEIIPHSQAKVWEAITRHDYLDRWLMKNDFEPVVGHRFTFQAQPMGDWDGVVHCEVLQCDAPNVLSYSWVGGSAKNPGVGSVLDSTLTITLTPVEGGTRFRLVHDGFRSPENDAGFTAMSGGWGGIIKRIEVLLAEKP